MSTGTIIGWYGYGGRLASEGIKDDIVDPLVKEFGWKGKVWTHHAQKAPLAFLEKHAGDGPVVFVGHSMGADTLDKVAEKYGKRIDAVFMVASAFPEHLPANVNRVYEVTGEDDFRKKFKFTGGQWNGEFIIPDKNHFNIDNSEELHKLIRDEIISVSKKGKDIIVPDETPELTVKTVQEILEHEGMVLETYKDSVGVLTVFGGITNNSGHNVDRYIGKPQTLAHALLITIWAMDRNYWPAVVRTFAGHAMSAEQFAAALSFHWNTGAIESCTWAKRYKAGDIEGAKEAFMWFDNPPSIIARRRKEFNLFFHGKWATDGLTLLYGGVNENMKAINGRNVDMSKEIAQTLAEHYGHDIKPPIKPPKDKPPIDPGDIFTLDHLRQFNNNELHNLLTQAGDLTKLISVVLTEREEHFEASIKPDNPDEPVIAETPEKETSMTVMEAMDGKKTITGILGGAAVLLLKDSEVGPQLVEYLDTAFVIFSALGLTGAAHKLDKLKKAIKK